METQTLLILDYLRCGFRLSPILALNLFGCFRLSARIYDIKKMGYIVKKSVITENNGKRFAEYYM